MRTLRSTILIAIVASCLTGPMLAQPVVVDTAVAGLWHFDETSGQAAADASPYHNNATVYGTTIVPGWYGNARSFNVSGSYVMVTNPANPAFNLPAGQSFSIDVRFKTTQNDTGEIIRRGLAPFPGFAIRILQGRIQGIIGDRDDIGLPSMLLRITSANYYNDGNWHHVRLTRDCVLHKLFLFVDDVEAATPLTDTYTLPLTSDRPLMIGRWENMDYPTYFRGVIDEVRISRSASTAGTQFEVPLTITDGIQSRILYFGLNSGMSRCVSSSDGVNGHYEGELPPFPPAGAFESRFVWFAAGSDPGCFGQGTPYDYRPVISSTQIDTFRVNSQPGIGSAISVSWATADIIAHWNGPVRLISMDNSINVDMRLVNHADLATASAPQFRIFAYGGGAAPGHFSPDPIPPMDFGTVPQGTTAHQNLSVTNTGTGPLTIAGVSSNNGEFTVSPSSAVVPAGSNQIFDIAFVPTSTGVQSGQVSFTHYGTNGPTTSLTVTGTGTGAAPAVEVPMTATMEGSNHLLYFGVAPGMTRCLNPADIVNGHAEGELPPFPPSGVPEIRFVYFSTGGDIDCFGQGTMNDYRPYLNASQRDTFKLKEQAGVSFTGTLSWPANMAAYFISAVLKYTGTAGPVTIDMLTTSSLDMADLMSNADPSTMTIYTQGPRLPRGIFAPDPIPSYGFGNVTTGNIAHHNFTVTNTGTFALNITGVASSNPLFSITPTTATIAIGGSQVFDMTFSPTAIGAQSGNITFTHDGSNGPTAVMAVGGTGAGPLTATPDPVAFGTVFILASASQNLTITNGSGAAFDVTGITLSTQFTLAGSPTFPVTIPGGGNAVFQIVYAPISLGAVSGATAVVSHTATGTPLTVGLTGTGVTAFAVAPAGPLAFGNVVVGDVSAAQNLTVTNASTGAMSVSAAAPAEYAVTPIGPISIPGGGNQVFAVTFVPTAIGAAAGNIVFTHTGGGSPAAVAANGLGVSQFSAEPSSLSFGSVVEVPPGTPVTLPVTVTNNATSASLVITGATIGDAYYSVAPTLATIPAGGNQVFNITFTPGPQYGPHNTTLTFAYVGGPSTVAITGAAQPGNSPKYVTITGDSVVKWAGSYYERPAVPWSTSHPSVPNWVNLLQQIVVRGGFAPNTPESDVKGGMVVGTSFMAQYGSGYLPARIERDTAWVRLTGWNSTRSLGYSYQQIQNTLLNNIRGTVYRHEQFIRGLDSTKNPGDPHRISLKSEQIGVFPRVSKNQLFAEQVALKINIVASAMGYTNGGITAGSPHFDQLVLNLPGNALHGMSVGSAAAAVDSFLTFWKEHRTQLIDAYTALYEINRAFPTSVSNYDTASWKAGTFRIGGTVGINAVPFLGSPSTPSSPNEIPETNTLAESGISNGDMGYDPNSDEMQPLLMKMRQNYPNPFNPSTTLNFMLYTDATITLRVYNLLGQVVATLLQDEQVNAGPQTINFDASRLSSGVYYYGVAGQDLETGASIRTTMGKMLLVK
jgi:hypothetical protein